MISLVNVKAKYGWSDKCFSPLPQVVHDILPDENTLPKSYYQAKKILCSMGIRRFMLARMIAYYTDMNFKKCPNALGVGYHSTK